MSTEAPSAPKKQKKKVTFYRKPVKPRLKSDLATFKGNKKFTVYEEPVLPDEWNIDE